MCPNPLYAEDHDAIPFLQGYACDGCPVDGRYDWSRQHIDLIIQRGPHLLDLNKKARRQLRQETADKITHKYARMVKWGYIKDKIPQK